MKVSEITPVEVLQAVQAVRNDYHGLHGPSYEELAVLLGFGSGNRSNVKYHTDQLLKQGLLACSRLASGQMVTRSLYITEAGQKLLEDADVPNVVAGSTEL